MQFSAGKLPATGDQRSGMSPGTTIMENLGEKYGVELILDLHDCDSSTFTRESIGGYFEHLCELIDMKREALHFWDDTGVPEHEKQTLPHTQGTSAVQFILTSSIVIHTLDQLSAVYVNMFSCKAFDPETAERFTVEWFGAGDCSARFIERI